MKVLYRISIFVNILCACYILIKGSELITKDFLRQDQIILQPQTQPKALPVKEEEKEPLILDETLMNEDISEDISEEVSAEEDTVTCDTVYSVLTYNVNDCTQDEKTEELPLSYIGKNRSQLIDLIEDYNRSASLMDLENGFISMELVSFSSEKIQVKKRVEKAVFYGCITVENGYLTVYDEKREKVILYTDIPLMSLPENIQQEILDGKFVETEAQLYNLLESYSS